MHYALTCRLPLPWQSAREFIMEDFKAMVYCTNGQIFTNRLEAMGYVAAMSLVVPIDPGLGIRNPFTIHAIIENTDILIIVYVLSRRRF